MKKILVVLISLVLLGGMSGISIADWDGDVTLGANLQSGNNDRASASIGANATQRIDDERYTGSFLFNYTEENDELSARNIRAKAQFDKFLTDKVYSYLNLEVLSDKFKNLNLRTVTGSGVGYQILDSDDASLSVEGGLSYFSEDVRTGEDNRWYTTRLAGNASIKVEMVTVTDSFVISPKLKDRSDYQIRNEASVSVPLATQWAVKLSNIFAYDSKPSVEIEKKDVSWVLGLQYNF